MKVKDYLMEDATSQIHSQAQKTASDVKRIIDKNDEHKENEINSIITGVKTFCSKLSSTQIQDFHHAYNVACGKLATHKLARDVGGAIGELENGGNSGQDQNQVTQGQGQNQTIQGSQQPVSKGQKPVVQGQKSVVKGQKPVVQGQQPTTPEKTPDEIKADKELEKRKGTSGLLRDEGTEEVHVNGKEKTLYQKDTLSSETFTSDLNDPPQHEFENNMSDYKGEDLRTSETFKPPDFIGKNGKYPKKYNDLISRMANTKMYGDSETEPPITQFIKDAGAGKIQAQAGEIMTMMFSTMSNDEVKIYSDSLLDHIKKNKDSKTVVTKDWVDAALNNRKAIHNMLKSDYKNIKIPEDIEASSWDTKDDVEALGMNNYDVNKGFSTDVYFKVKNPKGGYKLEEISLKKDARVNFLNSGTGKFREWDDKLKDEVNQIKYKDTQKGKLVDGVTKYKDDINKLLESDDPSVKKLKKLLGESTIDDALSATNRDKRRILKYSLEAVSKTNKEAKTFHDDVINDEREFKKAAVKEIIDNEKMRNGMLSEISKEFPLKSISDGEEKMAIGDMAVNKEVMKHIFGTDSWKDISERLVAVGGDEPYIAYKMDSTSKEIPIAKIRIRENGIGFGGLFKFEMNLDKGFAKELKDANKKLYKEEVVENKIYDILQKRLGILLEKYL